MSLEAMIEQNVTKPSYQIKKICAPLFRFFDINTFWMSKTTVDGSHVIIGGNPEISHDYYVSKSFVHSPFFRHPKLVQPGIYIYRNITGSKFQETVQSFAQKQRVELILSVVVKMGETMFRFGYGANPESASQKVIFLLNHMRMLETFHQYFIEEAKEMIVQAEDNAVDLAAYNPNFDLRTCLKTALDVDEQRNFLKSIHQDKYLKVLELNSQERECLNLLLKGNSAVLIAKKLFRSPRTVEHYIESLKIKLGCPSKGELFQYSSYLDF